MIRKTLSQVLLVTLLSISFVSCSKEEIASDQNNNNTPTNVTYTYSQDELELMNIINDYRVSIGKNRLEKVDFISVKSEEHDLYMISKGGISHDYFQDRYEALVKNLGAVNVSENLAYNYSTPQGVFNAWLNSAGHKANIEGDFSHFGIAIRTNSEGKKFYTNLFMKK
ncbi:MULTISPECIES: CAP domain-containing protein [unclassified Flavobacterium]|uniref:CAP domain-containing protein n=1 Tax=unclassified Flavobacterium TaxID=196869 RepID=UPI0036229545